MRTGMESSVIVNGERMEIRLPLTLEEFLVSRGLRPRGVVVERNGEAASPSEFSDIDLQEGDRLEIVRVVAGGR